MSRLRPYYALVLMVSLIAGCQPPPAPQTRDPGTVEAQAPLDPLVVQLASHQYGTVDYVSVLQRLQEDRAGRRVIDVCQRAAQDPSLTIDCYQEVASELAIGEALLNEKFELPEEMLAVADRNQRELALNLYLGERYPLDQVSEAEILERYEADKERFTSPKTATVWNIYRRYTDEMDANDTMELLRQLRQRFQAGETFSSLAETYSHSENASRGGAVGQIRQGGRLPARLDDIVFSLGPNEISDPIDIPGGAIILHVSEVGPGFKIGVDRASQTIRNEIRNERMQDHLREIAAITPSTDDDIAIQADQLIETLSANGDTVILKVDDFEMTAEAYLRNTGMARTDLNALDEDQINTLLATYQQLHNSFLGRRYIATSEDPAAVEARQTAAEQLRRNNRSNLIDAWYRAQTDRLLAAEPERLEDYFELHEDFYVTPIRYRLYEVEVPLRANALISQQALVDAADNHETLSPASLQQLATDLDGTLIDHGWMDFDQISIGMPPKARQLISQADIGEALPPYQQDDAIHLVWLADKEGAEPLDFESAKEEVTNNYLMRYGQNLWQTFRDEKLAEIDFNFDRHAAERALSIPEF